ncbi:MAG: sigma 54-interacting transcriptional regulator [Myxococcales bacterium]|nr:sigma 54-interacting transcriptional regulator [Myxococcales bacterium]HQY62943.1 sigma 54-interacting transcriptional regulator [Polyangiaceae bacterium]
MDREIERDTDLTVELPTDALPGERGEWVLEVHQRHGTSVLALGEAPFTLGSSRRASHRLEDPMVSGVHCEVALAAGRLRVVDLGSRNGTYVGPARVREAWAGVGGTITLGETQLVVQRRELDDEAAGEAGEPLPQIAGGSLAMRRLAARVRRLANRSSPVLVSGETGTGKELVAQALHTEGKRRAAPFVPVNVAALPRELVESELFGHERGAFTGAVARRAGAFGDAQRGTLFLDEIGELPLDAQPKLLRALDGYEVRRVGSGGGGERADVRVVAATHKALLEDVQARRFRRDLYHRLEAFVLELPPLRERRGDVAAIARRLLAAHASEIGPRALTPAALARLAAHDWPGNVRELRNVLLRAAELADDGRVLTDAHIARGLRRPHAPRASPTVSYGQALLEKHGGNFTAAARDAGMPRTSFRKLVVGAKAGR